jgi:hypothetical protein
MKNHSCHNHQLNVWVVIVVACFSNSCGTWRFAPELIGTWKTGKHKITVRAKSKNKDFQFISDSIFTTLTINSDKTVDGTVGWALLENGKTKTNWLLPTGMTGVAYTIQCDLIGQIFENDPLEMKEVEFWISPLKENIKAGLRYTKGMAKFPMAHIILLKEGD